MGRGVTMPGAFSARTSRDFPEKEGWKAAKRLTDILEKSRGGVE